MIRRTVENEHWLITQNDHAQLSGKLAESLGNERFAAPSSASAVLGIAMHDGGWALHDDAPTLDRDGQPLDVFQTPPAIGLAVWDASAERAASRDDYAGLLVSLHSLGLSVFVTETNPLGENSWDLADPRIKFELNRFQHKMIELQESLRQRLGLRTDRPLQHGLSNELADPREARLRFDFRWLGAMDRLSLAICCTKSPFASLDNIHPRPAAPATAIRVERPEPSIVRLDPWPFRSPRLEVQFPFRRLPARVWPGLADFRDGYSAAPIERFTVAVEPLTMSS